jgi:hypothetical protein
VGTVTSEIDLKGMHGGPFKKYITVQSNARNSPSLRLSLGGVIKSELDYSPQFIRLSAAAGKELVTEVILSTEKKDFTVTEVTFKPRDSGSSQGPEWQSALPIYVNFSIAKPDSVKADGYYDYKLKVTSSYNESGSRHGEFIIKTNHPKRKELTVPGMIERTQ